MAQANKKCKICGEIGHSRFYCRQKNFSKVKYTASINKVHERAPDTQEKQKRINSKGKYGKRWDTAKKEWKKLNPPDENGFWHCKIGGASLSYGSKNLYGNALILNVCHDKSRARYPSLAYNLDNLFPGCQKHNRLQGSKSFDEFMSENPDLTCGNY